MARRPRADRGTHVGRSVTPPPLGGRFQPLSDFESRRIVDHAFQILSDVGMAGSTADQTFRFVANGARRRDDGRVCFSQGQVEDALARAPRHVEVPGFQSDRGVSIGGGSVHIGTGGAAVQILEADGQTFRDATLSDLYRLMRILDCAQNIHYGVRPVVARDMTSAFDLDINTAFACLKATSKPIGVSFSSPSHVPHVIGMFDQALGGEGKFRKQPFCLGVIVHVVPPLRFAEEGCAVLEAAINAGMIPQICSAGQAGATSPVSLAGALAQGLAECFAGLMAVDTLAPGHPCIYAFMPFISDLRTGAMTGGSGEAAIANAAAAQLLGAVGLPSTVSAGMTDANVPDAQAGYEKGYTVALAAHAGADMINLAVGMLGSIMVASPEALVLDDDMCGAILRSVTGIEVSDETLDLAMVERVVTGEGHYLGEAATLARMKTEYVYPGLANRQSVSAWLDAGGATAVERAHERVTDLLRAEPPRHLHRDVESSIRAALPIHLPEIV